MFFSYKDLMTGDAQPIKVEFLEEFIVEVDHLEACQVFIHFTLDSIMRLQILVIFLHFAYALKVLEPGRFFLVFFITTVNWVTRHHGLDLIGLFGPLT